MNNIIKRVLIEETNQIIRVKPMFMYSKHNYKSRVWTTQTEHYLCESIDSIKIDDTIRSNVLLICHESLDRVKKYYKNEELLIFDRITDRSDYEYHDILVKMYNDRNVMMI